MPTGVLDDTPWLNISLFGDLAEGGIITTQPKTLGITLECFLDGSHNVTMVLPLQAYSPVYFGFTKVCPRA